MVFRFQSSLRDIEELLFERGVIATYRDVRPEGSPVGTPPKVVPWDAPKVVP